MQPRRLNGGCAEAIKTLFHTLRLARTRFSGLMRSKLDFLSPENANHLTKQPGYFHKQTCEAAKDALTNDCEGVETRHGQTVDRGPYVAH